MRLVIVGGGPAGNHAASTAARLGAEVTLVERDVLGGGAHLWDCIPSKAMVASGNALTALRRARSLGIDVTLSDSRVDLPRVSERISDIWRSLNANIGDELGSQGVRLIAGSARLLDDHRVAVSPPGGDGAGDGRAGDEAAAAGGLC